MKSLRLIFWISVIVASIQPIKGQKLPLKHYSTDNGLPSSETYSIFQDSKFRYWICTDNGISMFNGRSFTNFSIKDGLPTNTIFSSFENKKDGRIWFITYGFGLCYYDEINMRFEAPQFNDILIKVFNRRFVNSCQFDNKNNLWITYNYTELIQIDTFGRIKYHPRIKNNDNSGFEILNYNGAIIIRNVYGIKSNIHPNYSKKVEDNRIVITGNVIFNLSTPKIVKLSNTITMFTFLNKLFLVTESENIPFKELPSNILSLSKDDQNNIWVGTESHGLFKFTNFDLNSKPLNFTELKNLTLSSIMNDNTGKIWFTTLTEGIFCFSNIGINNFQIGEKIIYVYAENDEIKLLGKGKLFKKKKNLTEFDKFEAIGEIKEMKLGPDKKIYICNSGSKASPPDKLDITNISGRTVEFISNSILVGGVTGITIYDNNFNFKKTVASPSAILKFCKLDSQSILVGCLNGLYIFSKNKFTTVSGPDWLVKTRINELVKHGNDIYVLTDGKGILIYRDGTIIQPNLNNGAVLNSSNCLQFESNSLFWVGTNEGLFRAKLKSKNTIEIIQKLTINDGLPSNEINDIKIVDTKLYVATNNGLSVFDFNIKTTNRITPLFLDLILGNFKDTLFNGYSRNVKLDLPKEWRNLYLKFSTNYDNTNKILGQISYRLIRNKAIINNWTNISDNNVQFTNLEPGKYKFQFRITDPILKEQYNSVATFTIQPYYYERFWVKVSFYVLLLALVILIVWMAFKKIKFDSEIKRKMISAEISSLRNQMNPHFIFNALNSIQYYIFENDEEQASKFLTKFSKLIRKSLEFSKLNFISIKAEIDFLNEYLEIEKVRFKNKFNYEIDVDTEIEQDICKIPPLLMQPLIENSIKHGFSGANENCMIWIKIIMEGEDTIVYSVRDNGKGINTGKVNDPDYKTSLSHEILKERFVLLKNDFGKNSLLGMTINNHIFEGKYGTEIILKLPLKYD